MKNKKKTHESMNLQLLLALGLLFKRRHKLQSDKEDKCAFLLVVMAAIGAISFGQTNKVFKANIEKPKRPSVLT